MQSYLFYINFLIPVILCILFIIVHIFFENKFKNIILKYSSQVFLVFLDLFFNLILFIINLYNYFNYKFDLYGFLYQLIFINLFFYIYFHIFNLSDTGRRIRILIDIKINNKSKYNQNIIILNRINRLIHWGQLKRDSRGKLYLNSKFLLFLGLVIQMTGNILFGKKRGFKKFKNLKDY